MRDDYGAFWLPPRAASRGTGLQTLGSESPVHSRMGDHMTEGWDSESVPETRWDSQSFPDPPPPEDWSSSGVDGRSVEDWNRFVAWCRSAEVSPWEDDKRDSFNSVNLKYWDMNGCPSS